MSGRTEGGKPQARRLKRSELRPFYDPKPMPLIQRNRLHQPMPVLIAHMGNIDHGQRIGRLDSQDIARLQRRKLLAASQNLSLIHI